MQNNVIWSIDFRDNINVDELNKKISDFYRSYPLSTIILQVPSTKGAVSSLVEKIDNRVKIRIASAYDDERIEAFKNVIYKSGATWKEAYFDSVVYTRNETIRILREIEKIESGIMENWSDLQKTIYIYDKLKESIMYDHKYEKKTWSEIRSLRGLITKQTVCAGYSLILKEILERNGITCQFITGNSHAWNVIIIDDNIYSADLTCDNSNFISGKLNTHEFLGQDPNLFRKNRPSEREEPHKHLMNNLSTLNGNLVKEISESVNIEKEYDTVGNIFRRNDGTSFYLVQVDSKRNNNKNNDGLYNKYYYADIDRNGNVQNPKILHSKSNINRFVNKLKMGTKGLDEYSTAISNVLFSKENIESSETYNTSYIGEATTNFGKKPVRNINQIIKKSEEIERFKILTRIFERSNGTKILVEYTNSIKNVNGRNIYKYTVYESITKNNKIILKENTIYSEEQLLTTKKTNISDKLLSREMLKKHTKENGGYIGYINDKGKMMYNPEIAKVFNINKRREITNNNPDRPIILPTFKELEDLAYTYEILYNKENNEIVVRNIKNKKILNDERKKIKAIFANIWLYSAGFKTNKTEARKGINEAFKNEYAKLYNEITQQIMYDMKYFGYIDTVKIYNLLLNSNNLNADKIFANLFKNEFQTNIIYQLFYNIVKPNKLKNINPEILYNVNYANSLVQKRFGLVR